MRCTRLLANSRAVFTCAVLLAVTLPVAAQSDFVRGDCNADGGIDIGDTVFLLAALFSGGPQPDCEDACDTNDGTGLDISDVVYELGFLFAAGTPPVAPHPDCGADPTPDAMGCTSFPLCAPAIEDCTNGIDDDGDGFIDCQDLDCSGDPACALSHAVDIQPIWGDTGGTTGNCTFCHGGVSPFAGLSLEPADAYSSIVDVPSSECTVLDRIEPGDLTNSWLWRKLLGTHTDADITALGCGPGAGGSMPPPAFCCPTPAEVDLIEQWILGGANP
jgi:hypothetical protein